MTEFKSSGSSTDKLNFSSLRSGADKLNFGDNIDGNFAIYYTPFKFDVKRYRELILRGTLKIYQNYQNFPRYFRVVYKDSNGDIVARKMSPSFKNSDSSFQIKLDLPEVQSEYTDVELEILIEKYEENDHLGIEGLGFISLHIYLGEEVTNV